MTTEVWGLLGPEVLGSERRVRTLGVGAAVRAFNDLAVPGLGGAWFGKQLFLATLGVAVAERVRAEGRRAGNIEVANAIEALACWLALNHNGWAPDARLRGATKMRGKQDLSFSVVRKSNFYVTQPMRMATLQPLSALGLVDADGTRFNAFACSKQGRELIDAFCADQNPCYYSKSVLEYLCDWTLDKPSTSNIAVNGKLRAALSPIEPMANSAREVLKSRLLQGGRNESIADRARRRAALAWVDMLREPTNQPIDWSAKPDQIDDAHWHDLYTGALFFMARDAALGVLDRLETHIGNMSAQRFSLDLAIPERLKLDLRLLRDSATTYLKQEHPDEIARAFCRECVHPDDTVLLANIVRRDERVLRLCGRVVLPGPAFRGSQNQESNADIESPDEAGSAAVADEIALPKGISHRIRNMFYLNLDMHGELSTWLGRTTALTGAAQ